MSYLVLARKWRPRLLDEVVGQDHVVRALSHALDNERLHHAYLFTGTRGVGKTTLARILAKALNCEKKVSSTPCNECTACTGIDEGKLIDLIEVDAASRTKVEDTRALLENVPYQPTAARFKVYLIDEIHMLSGHSFNALLKTLEEPPGHVKFLLATTDPQKLPVTVLSRCLQFNLRALDVEEIQSQLKFILEKESIEYDDGALAEIARQARGSLRDALSMLDQAISFTGESVKSEPVRQMLGMISHDYLYELIRALAEQSAENVMETISRMCTRAVSFTSVLDELLLIFHDLSLLKTYPKIFNAKNKDANVLEALSQVLSDEDLQLYYQIGMIGKRDLHLAPDPRSGFEMIMLRMLCFTPATDQPVAPRPSRAEVAKPARSKETFSDSPVAAVSQPATPPEPKEEKSTKPTTIRNSDDWIEFVSSELKGTTLFLAKTLSFDSIDEQELRLNRTDGTGTLADRQSTVSSLQQAIQNTLKRKIRIKIQEGTIKNEPLSAIEERKQAELIEDTRDKLMNEEIPVQLVSELGGSLNPDSVQPPAKTNE